MPVFDPDEYFDEDEMDMPTPCAACGTICELNDLHHDPQDAIAMEGGVTGSSAWIAIMMEDRKLRGEEGYKNVLPTI